MVCQLYFNSTVEEIQNKIIDRFWLIDDKDGGFTMDIWRNLLFR